MGSKEIKELARKIIKSPTMPSYNLEDLVHRYNYSDILKECENNPLQAEIWMLGIELCGTANGNVAFDFMNNKGGESNVDKFLENVSYNSERSNGMILRAINIRESQKV